ncbi:MAG TPA: DNA adenine methylase [Blastocatellia bacterium]
MAQPALFLGLKKKTIVNVASVPQRSPFRYPGGKTWLVPRIRKWLSSLPAKPAEFIEPFAGGGIVSLTVAAEGLADHVTMVELDEQVAAVWETVIGGNAIWLGERICSFELTDETLKEELAKTPVTISERAFQTILKNRTFRGGILAAGAAPLKAGENGKGIKSRWYPETLKKRLTEIDSIRERISFNQGDGIQTIRENAHQANSVFFIDPPYTAAGKRAGSRLYNHSELDHEKLFRLMSTVNGDFLLTYDAADGAYELARRYQFDTELVSMKNAHHAEMTELLIGRNLNWARN